MENCTDPILSGEDFFDVLYPAEKALCIVCACLTVIALIIFVETVIYAFRHHNLPYGTIAISVWLIGLCPFLSTIATTAILVPRANLFCDLLIALVLSVVFVRFLQYHRNCIKIHNLYNRFVGQDMKFDVTPCCCLRCIPSKPYTRERARRVRYFVFQYPVINVFFLIVSMVTYLDGTYDYGVFDFTKPYPYVQILRVISTIAGIYAMSILYTVGAEPLKDLQIHRKYRILRLSLLANALQNIIFDIMAAQDVFGTRECTHGDTLGKFYQNIVFVIEMFLLTLLTMRVYRAPFMQENERIDTGQIALDNQFLQSVKVLSIKSKDEEDACQLEEKYIPTHSIKRSRSVPDLAKVELNNISKAVECYHKLKDEINAQNTSNGVENMSYEL